MALPSEVACFKRQTGFSNLGLKFGHIYGSFRKIRVPYFTYFGVIIRIILFRVLY